MTSAEPGSEPADDPRCRPPREVERVDIARGTTARTELGIAATYEGTEHDNFEDDAFFVTRIVLQGILEDGELTPSALTWRHRVSAQPVWVHHPMSVCTRLVEVSDDGVSLDIGRPSPPR